MANGAIKRPFSRRMFQHGTGNQTGKQLPEPAIV